MATTPNETKQASDTVTVSAGELREIMLGYDAAVKQAAAELAEKDALIAELSQKKASAADEFEKLRKAAVASLIKFNLINEGEEKKAYDQMADWSSTVSLLTKAIDPSVRTPKAIGQAVTKEANTKRASTEPRGRFTERPDVRDEVNARYLADLELSAG